MSAYSILMREVKERGLDGARLDIWRETFGQGEDAVWHGYREALWLINARKLRMSVRMSVFRDVLEREVLRLFDVGEEHSKIKGMRRPVMPFDL